MRKMRAKEEIRKKGKEEKRKGENEEKWGSKAFCRAQLSSAQKLRF